MKVAFVDLKGQYQSIRGEIDRAIREVIERSAFIKGPFVTQFEQSFAAFVGVEHCIGVGNGTDALFVTLKALGIGSGAEVICPANSFVATSEAVTQAGAQVIFVDCDPGTRNIDVSKLVPAITQKTRAIIPVHLYGQPADMGPILDIARQHDLRVVEDAAQAHGAQYHGGQVGTFGDAACFSFYPGKNLGAYGDGGAVVTGDPRLAERVRMWANHGRKDKYDHEFGGTNSRLDGLQAAILSVKLKHLPDWIDRRRAAASRYDRAFESRLETPRVLENAMAVYHLYVVLVDDRDRVRASLAERGIATRVHYPIPLPSLEAYKHLGHTASDFPVATADAPRLLSLPMHEMMEDAQVDHVVESVFEVLG